MLARRAALASLPVAALVLTVLVGSGCAGSSGRGGPGVGGGPAPRGRTDPSGAGEAPGRSARDVADDRDVGVRNLTEADRQELADAWRLFVADDPRWPEARDRWLAKGGAAPYVLAENLFRYWWSADGAFRRDQVLRVGENARAVGEPAVAYFAKVLVTDRWPLREPVTQQVFNPDNVGKPLTKTFTHFDIDDQSRQNAAMVLAAIGEPAVPTLTSPAVMRSEVPSARVYGAYALGAIASDRAVEALGTLSRTDADWKVRGAAVKGLGFALQKGNASARPAIEAALKDSDDFVRRKAQEALAGKTRIEF